MQIDTNKHRNPTGIPGSLPRYGRSYRDTCLRIIHLLPIHFSSRRIFRTDLFTYRRRTCQGCLVFLTRYYPCSHSRRVGTDRPHHIISLKAPTRDGRLCSRCDYASRGLYHARRVGPTRTRSTALRSVHTHLILPIRINRLSEQYNRKLDVLNRGFSGYTTRWIVPIFENVGSHSPSLLLNHWDATHAIVRPSQSVQRGVTSRRCDCSLSG